MSDDKLKVFNAKVASLVKEASPDDLVHILKDPKSILVGSTTNVNNNKVTDA